MGTFLGNLYASIGLDTSALKKGAQDAGRVVNGLDNNFKNLSGTVLSVKGIIASTGAVFAAFAAKDLWNTAVMVDQLNRSFKTIFNTTREASIELDFIRNAAKTMGQEFYSTTDSFKFIAAAAKDTKLEGAGVRDIFLAVSEAGATLGLTNEQVKMSLYAISQMISKGTVNAEELRQQLGERLPGAYQAMARALGVTTAELNKMLEQGQLVAEEVLPLLAKELHKLYKTGAAEAADSPIGIFNQFKTAWIDLKAELADKAFIDAATDSLKAFTELMKDREFINNLVEIIRLTSELSAVLLKITAISFVEVTKSFNDFVEALRSTPNPQTLFSSINEMSEAVSLFYKSVTEGNNSTIDHAQLNRINKYYKTPKTVQYNKYADEKAALESLEYQKKLNSKWKPAASNTKSGRNKEYNEYKRYTEALIRLTRTRIDAEESLESKRFQDGLIGGKEYYEKMKQLATDRYQLETDSITDLMSKADASKKKTLAVELEINKEEMAADLAEIDYELAQYSKKLSITNKKDMSRLFQETKDLEIQSLENRFNHNMIATAQYYNDLIALKKAKGEEEIAALQELYKQAGVDEKKTIEIDIIIKKKEFKQEIDILNEEAQFAKADKALNEYYDDLDTVLANYYVMEEVLLQGVENTTTTILEDFGSVFKDGLTGDLKSFGEYADMIFGNILDSFIDMVTKIAAQQFLSNVAQTDWIGTALNLGSMLTGGVGTSTTTAAGGSVLSNGAIMNPSGAVFKMANGGFIGEDVYGRGAASGKSYQFHANEFVIPHDDMVQGGSGGGSSSPQPINIYNVTDPRELRKSYGTSEFQNAVMNVVGSNSRKIRRIVK